MQNIYCFLEQEIDYEALICLEAKDLIELLPKAWPRAKFNKKLEALKLATTEVSIYLLNYIFKWY